MANIYSVIVFVSGILGLFLQAFSLVTWGWLQINFSTETVTPQGNSSVAMTLKSSLWRVEVCTVVNATNNITCTQSPKSDLGKIVGQMENGGEMNGQRADPDQQQDAVNVLYSDFDVLPYLTCAAFSSSVLGLLVFTLQYCSCCAKTKIGAEIISILFWLIAVSLLAAAVGIGGHLNTFLSNIYTMVSNMKLQMPLGYDISMEASVPFPWSILLSGLGMALCFINIIAIVIDICVTKFKKSTNYWRYDKVHFADDHQSVETTRGYGITTTFDTFELSLLREITPALLHSFPYKIIENYL